MQEVVRTSTASTANIGMDAGDRRPDPRGIAPAYSPSWLDRTTLWISHLPIPGWLFYLLLAAVAIVLEAATKWADGTYPVGTFVPFHVVFAATIAYILAVHRYLVNFAVATKNVFRPTYEGHEDELEDLIYQLTTSPARVTLLWSVGGAGMASLSWLWLGDSLPRYSMLSTSPLAAVFDYLLMAIAWALIFAISYYSIHMIRVLGCHLIQPARINIFKLGSLYAFSGLTGRVAVAFILAVYIWYIADPAPADISVWHMWRLFTTIALAVVAVAVFVWPLVGVHNLLETQKRELLEQNAQKVQEAMKFVYTLLDTGELADLVPLKNATDSLIAEQNTLEKLRTWPWHPDTLRLVSTVLLLPLVAYLMERILTVVLGQ